MNTFLNNHNITQTIEKSWKNRENSIALIHNFKKYSFNDLKFKIERFRNFILNNENNHNKRLVIISNTSP